MIRELVLWFMLSAVAYRATRLVVRDTLPPLLWARDRLAGGWRRPTEAEWRKIRSGERTPAGFQMRDINGEAHRWVERVKWSPDWLAELITCPWCASGWVSGGVVLITDCVIGIQWPWLMGGAVWAVSALIAGQKWS